MTSSLNVKFNVAFIVGQNDFFVMSMGVTAVQFDAIVNVTFCKQDINLVCV